MDITASKTATITFNDKEAREILDWINFYVTRSAWNPTSVQHLTTGLRMIA